MESKHTPGPWKAVGPLADGVSWGVKANNAGLLDLHNTAATHRLGCAEPEVMEANAALIAAAPDMYEALQQLNGLFPEHDYASGIIRAALAKAEGRA